MNTYSTAQVARMAGVHPNTVRLYETIGFLPAPVRKPNGYRVFTEVHVEQMTLIRLALRVEILQNGLRARAVEIIKTAAQGRMAEAAGLTDRYLEAIRQERRQAEGAIESVKRLLARQSPPEGIRLRRQEAAEALHISMDALRNWEMNGLLTVKRRENGYRVYTESDLERLCIIRSLRCANYSLSAILRMLGALTRDPETDIRTAIDTPDGDEDIITACDKLLTSLAHAEESALLVGAQLDKIHQLLK